MVLNNFKCNHLMPLHVEGLKTTSYYFKCWQRNHHTCAC